MDIKNTMTKAASKLVPVAEEEDVALAGVSAVSLEEAKAKSKPKASVFINPAYQTIFLDH